MALTPRTPIGIVAATAIGVTLGWSVPVSSAQSKPYLACTADRMGSGYLGVCSASSSGNYYRMYVRCRSSTGRSSLEVSRLAPQGAPVLVECRGSSPTSRYFRVYTV
ncbi:hypothetical protein [Luteimonas kalidii]|uniref:Secreted protein n=1 Tax=Luteimonas kalidii TaxID=3042025 RepID=A0ABT6JRU9_9GAMM|nr:hypothetical protein [Luteimonas kalidii]MDH5833409.1 hypothetical protein [Luteimonas kalidii]